MSSLEMHSQVTSSTFWFGDSMAEVWTLFTTVDFAQETTRVSSDPQLHGLIHLHTGPKQAVGTQSSPWGKY